MKIFTYFALFLMAALLLYAAQDLPAPGDAAAPAATHVSPRYLERSYQETGTRNVVTAVLADYRSYDTLGESVVIFTAGLACLSILGVPLQCRGPGDAV